MFTTDLYTFVPNYCRLGLKRGSVLFKANILCSCVVGTPDTQLQSLQHVLEKRGKDCRTLRPCLASRSVRPR